MFTATPRVHSHDAGLPTLAGRRRVPQETPQTVTHAPIATNSLTFGDQLASALQTYFNGAADGKALEITITPQGSQTSGTRQFVVTVKNDENGSLSPAAASPGPSTPASTLINYGAMSPFVYGAAKFAAEHPDGIVQTAPTETAEPAEPVTATDAYWAQFPKEVQALREIPDRASRIPVAQELVARGFSVDNEIMVMGYDPYETMTMRQQLGYTWIPAMGQPFIEVPPGMKFPGKAPYDPNNPPAGSITVSVEFAKGLESTSAMFNKYEMT